MSSIGFVYALINRAMPGLVKIGFTMGSPSARAAELSSPTGVPLPFEVLAYCEVVDPRAAEMRIHAALAPARIGAGREFFAVRCYRHASDLLVTFPGALSVGYGPGSYDMPMDRAYVGVPWNDAGALEMECDPRIVEFAPGEHPFDGWGGEDGELCISAWPWDSIKPRPAVAEAPSDAPPQPRGGEL